MCAINPVHKKRLILDVYTSDRNMTKEEFERIIAHNALEIEIQLNRTGLVNKAKVLRWHLKETSQEAE